MWETWPVKYRNGIKARKALMTPPGDRVLQEAAKQLRGNDPRVHARWTCRLDLAYGVDVRWVRGRWRAPRT